MTYIPGGAGGSNKVSTSQDVALNNPINGQPLVYSGGLQKWTNGPVDPNSVDGLINELVSLRSRIESLENGTRTLEPVTNLTAASSTNSITLNWVNPNPIDAEQIIILRAPGSVPPALPTSGTPITTISATAATYTDSGLATGTQYSYSLFTRNSRGDYSPRVSVTATTTGTGGGVIRINVGGAAAGSFAADDNTMINGNRYAVPSSISSSLPEEFGSGRWAITRIEVPVSWSTKALIKVGQVEDTFNAAGERLQTFSTGEGDLIRDYDLFASVGKGVVKYHEWVVPVVNGKAVLLARSSVDNPVIHSIEVSQTELSLTPVINSNEPPQLLLSTVANRANPVVLNGQQLSGNAYIFVTGANISSVSFTLDGGTPRNDTTAPFDLVGGDLSSAQALDVASLALGSHTINAQVTFTNSTQQTLTGTFNRVQVTTGEGILPRWSDDLVDSMAVCTHTNYGSYTGGNYTKFQNAVAFSKLRYLRDDSYANAETTMRNIASATGVKFITIGHHSLDGNNNNVDAQRAMWDRNLNIIAAFGGPNEKDRSIAQQDDTKAFMPGYSTWARATAARQAIPLLGPSATTWLNGFGDYPYRRWGDMTNLIDMAEVHSYYGGREPENRGGGHDDNHEWLREVEQYHNKSDFVMPSGAYRIVATETGYHTMVPSDTGHKGTAEAVDGVYVARMYAYYFGWLKTRWTCDYELLDQTSTNTAESRFGWVRPDGSYKPSMHTVRNMITLLEDKGSRPALARLNYTISNKSSLTKDLLLQTRDGRYRLLVWEASKIWDPVARTTLSPAARSVTINLPSSATSVKIFQPDRGQTLGTQALTEISSTSSILLNSNQNLKIVEITF